MKIDKEVKVLIYIFRVKEIYETFTPKVTIEVKKKI